MEKIVQQYITTPLGVFRLVGNCIKRYGLGLRETWLIGLVLNLLLQPLVLFFWALLMQGAKVAVPVLLVVEFIIITFLIGLALIKAHHALLGRPISLGRTAAKIKSHYFPYAIICLIYLLLLYASLWLALRIAFANPFVGPQTSEWGTILGTGVLPLLIQIATAVIVIYFLIFAAPLILLDEGPFFASLRKSCHLVFHHWWHVFIFLILAFIVIAIWQFILVNIADFIFGFFAYINLPYALLIGQIIDRIIVGALVFPAWIIMILVIFNDLKLRIGQMPTTNLQI
jgi:hypothetical protein